MKNLLYGLLALLCLPALAQSDYPITPVDFTRVHVRDGFWRSRIDTVRQVTIPFAFEKSEETGRIDNFRKAAGLKEGQFRGVYGFDDSDVYKIMEGAAYSLMLEDDPHLESFLDTLIGYFQGAQEPDGYLYTAYTLKANDYMEVICTYSPEGKFAGTASSHELYNMGHMYEAAVAHYLATGKRNFLDVALKSADLIYDVCLTQGKPYYPGHQEIELGLVKLYRVTGEPRYLQLAKHFLDQRGRGLREGNEYDQDHKPVTEQDEAVGHSVRATYMYAAMADVAALTGDKGYLDAINKIWQNVVQKKLYVTGGIGASRRGEAFGENYDLPNNSYAETCAAIANVYWNHRMFLLHGESRYIDVLERTLYNGLLSGLSLDGKLFFYPNPLEHDGHTTFNMGGAGRQPWFNCSCCPTNLSRFVPSVAGYAYAVRDDEVYVNLFLNTDAELETKSGKLQLSQSTDYPWKGQVRIAVQNETPVAADLLVRIPGWARGEVAPSDLYAYQNPPKKLPTLRLNGRPVKYALENGYARLERNWQKGDVIELELPMEVRRVEANAKVAADSAKVALEYGPIVYCAEGVDNGGKALTLAVPAKSKFAVEYRPGLLSGVNVVKATSKAGAVTLIPYYAWNHRGTGEMTVWLWVQGN